MAFQENISRVIFYLTDQILLFGCLCFLRYLAIKLLQIFVFCDGIDFEIHVSCDAVFLHDQKSQDNTL